MSTDTNRKFPVAAVCAVLFALCIPGGATRLEPCNPDGLFEVVENSPTNKMTCRIDERKYRFHEMMWHWLTNGTTVLIGKCRRIISCRFSDVSPLFSVSYLRYGMVQLTIDTTNMTIFSRSDSFTNSNISCELYGEYLSKSTCRTDLVYPANDSKCNAHFKTSAKIPWSVESKCNVPKAYSALQRYSCQMFVAQEAVGLSVAMVTTPLGTDYVSGFCSMTSGLTSVGGNITVMIIPGRINVTTSAFSQPSSARVDHSCPSYVEEGSDLGCMCVTDDRGSPPGFLQWEGSSSANLRRANVSRADDGTVFTCQLLWNAKVVASKNHTLRVISIGYLIRQARSEGQASGQITGKVIGVGVSLAIAAIAVAVLVVVSWRLGWVLPCAEGPMPYEDTRPNEVNVPSVYEALRPGNNARASAAPDRTETTSVYQNCAFDSDNDRGGEVPAGKKKPKKHQKMTQNVVAVAESPLYGNV